MATQELTIRYPEGFEQVVHLTKAEMERNILLMAALKMFELASFHPARRLSWRECPELNSLKLAVYTM